MGRGIDHLVLPVRDLESARASYRRLGFTCTPDAVHPFGTGNFLVQLQGSFLEILGVLDRALFPAPGENGFSFPAFNDAFLAEAGEGFSMLVTESHDPAADRAAFEAAGLRLHSPFSFGRDAILPDGSAARVGFDLTFVSDPAMPMCGFFTCRQQHPPELFWKREYQDHPNTAQSVESVVLCGEDWKQHLGFLEGFVGERAEVGADHARLRTPRGDVFAGSPDFAAGFLGRRCQPMPGCALPGTG